MATFGDYIAHHPLMDKEFRRIFKSTGTAIVSLAHIVPFVWFIGIELNEANTAYSEPDLTFPVIFSFFISLITGFLAGIILRIGFTVYVAMRYRQFSIFKENLIGTILFSALGYLCWKAQAEYSAQMSPIIDWIILALGFVSPGICILYIYGAWSKALTIKYDGIGEMLEPVAGGDATR